MRHIKLFENFDANIGSTEDLIFDWMPFDDQISNPIQSSIPESMNAKELVDFLGDGKGLNPGDIQKAGLFMAHKKNPGGGFNRFITKSISPLLFELETFNNDFESVNKIENVNITDTNLGDLGRGASMLSRFGIFGKDDE
jgi:hypothetical protein